MPGNSQDHPDPQRLIRIEEQAAFVERAVEQLSEEIAQLNRRVLALTRRLDGLDHRLSRLSSAGAGQSDDQSSDSPVIS